MKTIGRHGQWTLLGMGCALFSGLPTSRSVAQQFPTPDFDSNPPAVTFTRLLPAVHGLTNAGD